MVIQKFRGTKYYTNNIDIEMLSKQKYQHTNAIVENGAKKRKYGSTDLMGKLEEFSDVWNDCPNIHNPKANFNSSYTNNKNKSNNSDLTGRTTGKRKSDNDMQDIHYFKDKFTIKNSSYNSKQDLKNKQTPSESYNVKPELPDSTMANAKRMKAVQEQRKLHVSKKKIIKQALSTLDSSNQGFNKKIIFSNEDEDSCDHNKANGTVKESKPTGRQQLFNEDDCDIEPELKINSQFEGKRGQKLLALQSKFVSDSRFTLDRRFAESGSESEDETPESEKQNNEKKKQFEILESIVGRQIKPLSDSNKKASKTLLLRFDPLREDHIQYIVKPPEVEETEEKPGKKQKKKKSRKILAETSTQEEESVPQVSKERFYEIKDDLKEALKQDSGQEFSLLKLFGPKDSKEPDLKPESSRPVKKLTHGSKNPFKYDSSDSEAEVNESIATKKDKGDECETQNNKNISWHMPFFFTEEDPRLKEALEFLKIPENAEYKTEYTQTRKILTGYLKKRYKNNLNKKGNFKKKLGGVRKGVFRKKKTK